ncbi:preprotein translocase subunit SecE [Flavobacterium sp. CS20]|jgi:preprotein translocase subunit SecE|uniref:preprotein translocase subunit SecE n=1 Tax=Flavobacterium sp. CS20 TaxID=2775246 RepID=UPI001B3A1EC1|nr:preprotein translocase subunit SecE [Flavobacterium sp. CS20]QTY27177.1 preprotein translocase subunit SecE [Flavobacterium sp. CS20]
MSGIIKYINESYYELINHVTWPSYADAQRLMVIVAVFSVLLALAVFGIDQLFSGIIEQYFNWVKS